MPKISDTYRSKRQQLILDAALRCFTRNGIAGTTMADIHRESGISVGGIYRYFPGKQDILLEITRQDQEHLNTFLTDVITNCPSPEAFFPAFMTALGRYRDEHPVDVDRLAVASWLEASTNPQLQELLKSSFANLANAFATQLDKWGIPQSEHENLTTTMRALVLGHVALSVATSQVHAISLEGLHSLSRLIPHQTQK